MTDGFVGDTALDRIVEEMAGEEVPPVDLNPPVRYRSWAAFCSMITTWRRSAEGRDALDCLVEADRRAVAAKRVNPPGRGGIVDLEA
jgi:hypothetical protein